MTLLDLVIVAIVVLSALFALSRGLIREVIALASWIVALVAAFAYAGPLASQFDMAKTSPVLTPVLAFGAIFIGVLIVGAVIAAMLSGAVRAIGLGWLDRLLGAAFGVVRGAVIVVIAVLLAGLTTLPQTQWWQNSALAPPFVAAASEFRDWLPPAWAGRLDFSGRRPASKDLRVASPVQRET
ncbi:MAG TPA: CvpA family protein [Burkholderiales bacterium]|nr:CvpA family protein [Burkholderiales bacterium]